MTQRQLNLIQSIQDGIKLAQKELNGPGSVAYMKRVLREEFIREDYRPLTAGRAAYIACFLIAWEQAGRPPIDPVSNDFP